MQRRPTVTPSAAGCNSVADCHTGDEQRDAFRTTAHAAMATETGRIVVASPAVGLLDDIAQINADAKDDATVLRHASVTLDHRILHFDRAAHGLDHAAEVSDTTIAGALHDAAVVDGNGRIDQVAAQSPQPCQKAVFIRAGERRRPQTAGPSDSE
jgi:hypothetical protein